MAVLLIAVLVAANGGVLYLKRTVLPDYEKKNSEAVSRLLAVPIMLYHNLDGRGEFSISSNELRRHFDLIIASNVRVVSLKTLVKHLEQGRPFPFKAIVITFDDGYRSMHDKLLPIVREYGFPVTLFVYTDFILERGSSQLTWDNLSVMDRSLIDIQSHSISHSDLTNIKGGTALNGAALFRELYLSKRIIEQRLQKRVDFFAFPYGYYSSEVIANARMAGYSRVFSTDYGTNLVVSDNYCLRRHHIKKTYSIEYINKIINDVL